LNLVFSSVMKWFKTNLLSLKLEKTYCMEFQSKYINHREIQIKYNNKITANAIELKFLCLILHNNVWKSHIDMLTSKLKKHSIW
jgi:hypothetical protein